MKILTTPSVAEGLGVAVVDEAVVELGLTEATESTPVSSEAVLLAVKVATLVFVCVCVANLVVFASTSPAFAEFNPIG